MPSILSTSEQELVALGAALAANCVPCIEHHIPAARAAGLTDDQIRAAILLADKVRQVPARKVLATAQGLLGSASDATPAPSADSGPCASSASKPEAAQACCG